MIPLGDAPGDSPRPSSEQPVAFFNLVGRGFETAARRSSEVLERFYSIGGYCVRLQFAGDALLGALTPAFEHLRLEPQPCCDLSVGLWDSVSTEADSPPLPWAAQDLQPCCGVRGYSDARIQVSYEPTNGIVSVLDAPESQGYFWIRDAARMPLYQCGSPLLLLLHGWMSLRGRSLVHGGAVGTPAGGVLLVGKGGSGKSTAALCCLDSPLLYAADDYGLVSLDPRPYFHSLYSSAKVNAHDAGRHPLIASSQHAGVLDTQKSLYFLHQCLPDKISTGFPLRAIVMPRVTRQRHTRLRTASSAQAMLALAPSTLFQLPGGEAAKFKQMSELVKALPAFVLESGTDWKQIPGVLGELVASLNTRASPRKF